jgi:3-oxoadipate enol-lactonase
MIESGDPMVEKFRAMVLATPAQGLAGAYAVVRDTDLRRTVALIPNPTLIIAGEYDTVTVASHGRALAATIPGAQLQVFPAVHLTNIEYPDEFLRAVLEFLLAAPSSRDLRRTPGASL